MTYIPMVLVVEDEPLIRLHAVLLVEEAGMNALQASNADDALAILERRNDIRVVFTDVAMPGSMDGLKLAWAVRDRWPPINLIVGSGHTELAQEALPDRSFFFSKPYENDEVISALKSFTAGDISH